MIGIFLEGIFGNDKIFAYGKIYEVWIVSEQIKMKLGKPEQMAFSKNRAFLKIWRNFNHSKTRLHLDCSDDRRKVSVFAASASLILKYFSQVWPPCLIRTKSVNFI